MNGLRAFRGWGSSEKRILRIFREESSSGEDFKCGDLRG